LVILGAFPALEAGSNALVDCIPDQRNHKTKQASGSS
jgi:hypothetical protein